MDQRKMRTTITTRTDQCDDMLDNIPDLKENGKINIIITGSNQEGQRHGGVNQRAVSERGYGGLGKRAIIITVTGRANRNITGTKNGTGNRSRNRYERQ